MAWGYCKGFVLEYDETVKKSVSCKDCIYFEKEDLTCSKKPYYYLPTDGKNAWKKCDCFELDSTTSNYHAKKNHLIDGGYIKKSKKPDAPKATKKSKGKIIIKAGSKVKLDMFEDYILI